MKATQVRYTVPSHFVAQNQTNISRVMTELRARRRSDLRYAVFLEDDGRTFVHLFECEDEDAERTLFGLEAFKTFQRELKTGGLQAPPQVRHLTRVNATETFPQP